MCEEFVGQGKRIVWTPSKPLRAAAVRIQVEGTHSLQIAAVEVFRAEGRQHKDDELHHFYDLMHTINEQQTTRTLDQIPSPLQEQSLFPRRHVTSREEEGRGYAPMRRQVGLLSRRGLGRLARIGPNRHLLSCLEWLRRLDLSPALAARIKRHKQPSGFDSHEVDRMYWTTLIEIRPRGPDQGPT